MTTATIAANVVINTSAPTRRTAAQSKRRIGLLDVITAFGEVFQATKQYGDLVESGAAPAEAARKVLLG